MITGNVMMLLSCWNCNWVNRYPDLIDDAETRVFVCVMCGEVIFAVNPFQVETDEKEKQKW